MKRTSHVRNKADILFTGAVFLVCALLFVGIFWWSGVPASSVGFEKQYFFLTKECDTASVGAVSGSVYLSGGAGYILEIDGAQSVVLACYPDLERAERIRDTLAENGTVADVLCLKAESWALRGADAEKAPLIGSFLKTADTCASVFYDAANALEVGSYSQEEARAAVVGALKVLGDLQREAEDYPLWQARIAAVVQRAREVSESLIFAKDLRYCQVALCAAIVQGQKIFT